MLLTKKSHYAINMILAMADGHGDVISIKSVAEQNGMKLPFLERVCAALSKNNILVSLRGPGGGCKLSKPLCEIKLSDVVFAVEEISVPHCRGKEDAYCLIFGKKCLAHNLWANLEKVLIEYCQGLTMEDVMNMSLSTSKVASQSNGKSFVS